MKKGIIIIGIGIALEKARLAALQMGEKVIDMNILSVEEAQRKLEEIERVYPKNEPIILKACPPMPECYADLRPKKPRYNPKTGKTKY